MSCRRNFKNAQGYTLAVVMVATSVLLVALSEAVINWQKAMQREREEELIFRGKQFMRAIELWQRKFPGTYPTTLDALLSTNNNRFLRKKWKDPITNSEEWRLIKMNPDGSISGLTIIPSGGGPLGPGNFGSTEQNRPGSTQTGLSSGVSGPGSSAGSQSNIQRSGRGQTGLPGQTPSGQSSSPFTPVLGGIVGVASKSDKESLKAYNGKTKYSEWEFYYVPRGPLPTNPPPGQQPGGVQTPGSQPPGSAPPSQPGAVIQNPNPSQPGPQ